MSERSDRVDLPAEIDLLLTEDLLDLVPAAREAGVRCSYHVLVRAALSGRLSTIKQGGRRKTSARAIREWIAALNQPRASRVPAQRNRRGSSRPTTSPAARRFLEARGLPGGPSQ